MNSLQYFGVVLLLLSIAVSEKDIPDGDSVRVPRALVLKPVVKVKTHGDEDDGPFDFIAEWLQKLIHPGYQKPTPSPLRLLVPGSAGGNNELFIEHVQPSQNTKSSFVIIRMTTDQGKGIGGVNNLGPIHGSPTTPFYPKPIFPSGPTRIIPKPGPNFFTAAPTMPTWPRFPTNNMNYPMGNTGFDLNHFHQNYGHFNNRNYPNFKNNFVLPKYPPPNYYNYKPFQTPSPQSFHPFTPQYNPQSGYGMNADMHNSISGMSAAGFHYGMDSQFRGNNYAGSNRFASGPSSSGYPRPHNNDSSHNLHSVGSEHVKVTLENVDLAPSSSSSSSSSLSSSQSSLSSSSIPSTAASPDSNTLDQFNRLDRMISTSPTYANRPWKPVRQPISSTTPRITSAADVRGNLDKDLKYSSQDIREIASPNLLNSWKAFVNSNNNVGNHNDNVGNHNNNVGNHNNYADNHNNHADNLNNHADNHNNHNDGNHVMKINSNFDADVQPKSTEKVSDKTRRATPSIRSTNSNNHPGNDHENELLKTRVTETMRKRQRKVAATPAARRISTSTSTLPTTTSTTTSTMASAPAPAPASTIIYGNFFTPADEELSAELKPDDNVDHGDEMMNASDNHVNNVTLSSIENVMNLTATALWRHRDIKRPSKSKLLERLKANGANRKVRIVESVKSSISVTSSKGSKRN